MKRQSDRNSFRTSGTNLTRAKSHNHRVVLEVVRTRGPVGRTEISQITSLSRQTVQNIVGELESAGLVEMQASKITGRGNPGMNVLLCKDNAFSLGFHVDQVRVTAVACNLTGEIQWSHKAVLPKRTAEIANSVIRELVSKFRNEHPHAAERTFGAGLAAPGPFGSRPANSNEVTSFSEFGSTENLSRLESLINLPVVIQNDASAAALGEHFYGVGRNLDNFALIHFGIGLGSGLVLNGMNHTGSRGNAGEIGHMIVELDGLACSCGNNGCLERYLSLNALCEFLGLSPSDPKSIEQIELLHKSCDPRIDRWLDLVAPRMRQAINIVESLVDPEVIIVGGIIESSFLESLLQRCKPWFSGVVNDLQNVSQVVVGTSGSTSIAMGASAVAVEALFAPSVSHLVL